MSTFIRKVGQAVGFRPETLAGGGRTRGVAQARAELAYIWGEVLGRNGRELARALGVRPQAVYPAARRGREARSGGNDSAPL